MELLRKNMEGDPSNVSVGKARHVIQVVGKRASGSGWNKRQAPQKRLQGVCSRMCNRASVCRLLRLYAKIPRKINITKGRSV